MKGVGTVIFLAVAAAGAYLVYQWRKIQQYTVTYGGQKLFSATADRVVADIYLNVTNPSDVDLTIDGYAVDMYVNGSFTGKLTSNVKQLIKAKSNSKFTVSLDFNPTQVLGQSVNITFLRNLIKNRSGIEIKLKGEVKIFGFFNLPVDITTPLG